MGGREMAVAGDSLNIEQNIGHGDLVGHELVDGMVLRIVEVVDAEHIRAEIVQAGESKLRHGVYPFKTKWIQPLS